MKILNFKSTPILEQLRIEEALLRADKENWCLINTGAPPAIVMGISGKPHLLLDLEKVRRDRIPVVKRFSGGGTVYIDPHTVFVTLICNVDDVEVAPQPKPILEWSEKLYQPLFKGFKARENDYVLGEKKFGGNAQYIQKGRWLHHTSFLWDFEREKMDYLLLPARRPKYRMDRTHADFLCTLRPQYATKENFIEALLDRMKEHFDAGIVSETLALEILQRPHRKVSTLLDLQKLLLDSSLT
ncbi:MAG: lipoate--protein ligase family protein [Chlamydiales bacterium]|nr:lipoate--protein ligase family protein [Chlamydiales bacterium]